MKHRSPRLIGVLHLPPLPGAPRAVGSASEVIERAGIQMLQEARSLQSAGFDGLILENFGDTPFLAEKVGSETVASLAILAAALRESVRVPLGLNVLRNDASAALGIATVTDFDFIRVNVWTGAAVTDQGIVQGQAAHVLRERSRLASAVRVYADICVKHARMLSTDDPVLAFEEATLRGGAEAAILTGRTTGRAVDLEDLKRVGRVARDHGVPLYIGSGATAETAADLLKHAHGIIVGSTLRKNGRAGAPLDPARIRHFIKAARTSGRKKVTSRVR